MPKTFLICLLLTSLLVVLIQASKKGGKSKGGTWGNSGGNRNPGNTGHGNTGGNWNPSHNNPGSNWNPSHNNPGSNWNPSHNNPGSNWNPSHNNPGSNWNPNQGSSWNHGGGWGNNYNPGGSSYNQQWKPPKNKMKLNAGALAAGAVGGFMLGSAFSNMQYRFDNDRDYRYYSSYHSQMPNQVYRPMYHDNIQVTEERFVTDCYNTTMTEFVTTTIQGQNLTNMNDTDTRVKSTIIKQMCVSEYRRSPKFYDNSGLSQILSPMLIFISLFVYFVVQ